MKLYNINETNLEKLFELIDSCTGKVELVGEDIRLNLKSKISQYFSLAKIFSSGEIPELEIVCYDANDARKLIDFMVSGMDV